MDTCELKVRIGALLRTTIIWSALCAGALACNDGEGGAQSVTVPEMSLTPDGERFFQDEALQREISASFRPTDDAVAMSVIFWVGLGIGAETGRMPAYLYSPEFRARMLAGLDERLPRLVRAGGGGQAQTTVAQGLISRFDQTSGFGCGPDACDVDIGYFDDELRGLAGTAIGVTTTLADLRGIGALASGTKLRTLLEAKSVELGAPDLIAAARNFSESSAADLAEPVLGVLGMFGSVGLISSGWGPPLLVASTAVLAVKIDQKLDAMAGQVSLCEVSQSTACCGERECAAPSTCYRCESGASVCALPGVSKGPACGEDECGVNTGNAGQPCCEFGVCFSADVECLNGTCQPCGGLTQVCCNGGRCDTGECYNGFCRPCGGDGKSCCEGGVCNNGLVCREVTTGTPDNHDVCRDPNVVFCDEEATAGGNDPVTLRVKTGGQCGTFIFRYNAISVPDRFIVRYGGRTVLDTGCVSGESNEALELCGAGEAEVAVQPNCDGSSDTAWNFSLSCPH